MRRLFFAAAILNLLCFSTFAQDVKDVIKDKPKEVNDTLKPYQKYPTLPAFNISMMDSVTIFNTYNIPAGKPIALLFFSPDCRHCKATVKALLKGMDSISNIQFYMFTAYHDLGVLRDFYNYYHLADYKNIRLVGRDYEFFFGGYYGATYVPDIALYDEHKKLVTLIKGEATASEIYKYIH